MKLGFISDTHGGYDNTVQALEYLKDCEQIIHVGDVLYHGPRNDIPATYDPKKLTELLQGREDIVYVRGNCDADVDEMVLEHDLSQKSRVIDFDHVRFYIIHGYEETEEERIAQAKELGCRVVVSGHTHVKVLKERDGIILLNPGSTTIPKDRTSSFAVYENGKIELRHLENGEMLKALEV
ncbi:phosphodiesterase [Bacillus andreraoultii]|uniref:phosphodiesterase n=1 Tax=Bacillus andreraoultii TaxID=1499685 RepID=UPI000539A281|nr:phosphodiesterase [Bacillus andreraoultii]